MSVYFIGIDIGTTNIKSVLYDTHFNELKVSSRKNQTINPVENQAEQDMNVVWTLTLETLCEVIDKSSIDPSLIKGIGIAGQGEGLWLVDKQGEPVRNAILWSDSRSADIVNTLNKQPELVKQIAKQTGSSPVPCNTSMIMTWMAQNEPQSLEKAQYAFFAKDWVRFKLTNKAGLDLSDAGTSILNLHTNQLSDIVFNTLNLNAYRRLFQTVSVSSNIFATITDEIAQKTGLSSDTLVCTGALDVAAAALGLGAMDDGDVFTIIGTTCCTGVVNKSIKAEHHNSRCVPHAVDGLYLDLTATLSGTPNIDWCIKNIAETEDFSQIEQQIQSVPAGAGGVVYHPYLSGERAPFYNENARASFFGINSTTSRSHLIRAVYEGVAFTIKDALQDYAAEGRLFLAGGGTNSPAWSQIIADVTGRTVICSSSSELSARGAAILAGLSTDLISDLKGIREQLFVANKIYTPNPINFATYNRLFELYKAFRLSVVELWDLRAQICGSIPD